MNPHLKSELVQENSAPANSAQATARQVLRRFVYAVCIAVLVSTINLLAAAPAQSADLATAHSAINNSAPAGMVTALTGLASAQQRDGVPRILARHSVIREGDVLRSEAGATLRVQLNDQTSLQLLPGSRVAITAFRFQAMQPELDRLALTLLGGGMHTISGQIAKRSPERVQMKTSAVVVVNTKGALSLFQCAGGECGMLQTQFGGPVVAGTHIAVADGEICASKLSASEDGNASPKMQQVCSEGVKLAGGSGLSLSPGVGEFTPVAGLPVVWTPESTSRLTSIGAPVGGTSLCVKPPDSGVTKS